MNLLSRSIKLENEEDIIFVSLDDLKQYKQGRRKDEKPKLQ